MANLLVNVMIVVFMCALSEARRPLVDLRRVTNDDVEKSHDPNALKKGPEMMHCMGKFMRNKYEMFCMFQEDYMVSRWTMDGVPLSNSTKYNVMSGKESGFKTLKLRINDLGASDVGYYTLNVANKEGTSTEEFYLTDLEACSDSMSCYEHPCEHPKRTCPSKPEAHCVAIMCTSNMEEMCRHAWYVGLERVTCPEDEM